MTPESLFLSTIDDLDQRLKLGRGEYDALCMAWLLRRLFHPTARALVTQVNDSRNVELLFHVRDDLPARDVNIAGWMPILPTDDGRPTIRLETTAFLKRLAVVLWPNSDPALRREISVKQLILFLADYDGAVHLSRPNEPWQHALAEYRDSWRPVESATTVILRVPSLGMRLVVQLPPRA